MDYNKELSELYDEYKRVFVDNEIVLGDGDINATLILIGEAPGKDEVRLSKPFVGVAGRKLAEFLSIIGIKKQDVYITNAIKYRLSKNNLETGRISNRPATKDEISQSRSYLLDEVSIINPKFIVTLGNVPLRAITGDYGLSTGTVHGQLYKMQVSGSVYNLFPLYHPASIIYNKSLRDIYYEDMHKLKEIIELFYD